MGVNAGARERYRKARWLVGIPLALASCGEKSSSEPSTAERALDERGTASDAGMIAPIAQDAENSCSGRCSEVETCCAGRCVDLLADAAHCGVCDRACDGQQATLACVDGACAIQHCAAGFVDCNGAVADGCERPDVGLPSAPRLVSPMQGEYTGSVHARRSLTPSLRWSAPASTGTCGALGYEVQVDDSCQRSLLSTCAFDSPEAAESALTSTTWAPSEPLPVQSEVPVGTTYAWRVRACEAAERCSGWSEARYLQVGRLRDDLNGDGYSEVVALTRDGESTFRTLVVPGGASLAGATLVPFESPNDPFGDVRFVGDVNGDGFEDVLRAQAPTFGLPTPVPDTPAFVPAALLLGAPVLGDVGFVPLPERTQFLAVAALGDWDMDGFDDFAVAEATSSAQASATSGVHLYFGGSSLDLTRALSVAAPPATTRGAFGNELEGGFDLDADGHPDLAIMDGDDGRIHIVRGGPAAPRSVRLSLSTAGQCNYSEGARLVRAGDMTGDGIAELAARCANRVLVYAGARSPGLDPLWQFVVGEPGSFYGADIAGGFDLGQDGLADFVFHTREGSVLTLMMLPGSTALGAASQPVTFGGNPVDPALGDGITVGDHDGDGRPDVVVPVLSPLFNLRRFAGARVTPSGNACAQPSASFENIGNWCDAMSEDIEDRYVGPAGDERSAGDSFGFTLGR